MSLPEGTPQPTATPEFVRWAIAQPCPLREFEGWQDPEQVERRLRPLRSYCEAVAEGRLFEGICVASAVTPSAVADGFGLNEAKGFRAAEVLAAYGGEQFVSETCGGCPANARLQAEPRALVGCYGHMEFSGLDRLHADLESVAVELGLQTALATEFPITTPLWYGLWIQSPPREKQLALLAQLFAHLAARDKAYCARLDHFLAAIRICLERQLPIHLTLVPRGEYTATKWTIVAHCRRCKAPWPGASRRCAVCGQIGRPEPSKRRNVRGERPYWRLAGFLGPANVAPFLKRYLTEKWRTEK
jgi:hypothetical protein